MCGERHALLAYPRYSYMRGKRNNNDAQDRLKELEDAAAELEDKLETYKEENKELKMKLSTTNTENSNL